MPGMPFPVPTLRRVVTLLAEFVVWFPQVFPPSIPSSSPPPVEVPSASGNRSSRAAEAPPPARPPSARRESPPPRVHAEGDHGNGGDDAAGANGGESSATTAGPPPSGTVSPPPLPVVPPYEAATRRFVTAFCVAAWGGSSKAGSSCHQCKTRRDHADLIFCRTTHQKKGRSKRRRKRVRARIAERRWLRCHLCSGLQSCRKKYCSRCLVKFYNEMPPTKKTAQ